MAENQSTVENAKEKLDLVVERWHHHAGWKTPFRKESWENCWALNV